MAKLQKITRSNMSEIYSVNFPKEIIEETGWEKGQDLEIKTDGKEVLIRSKEDGSN